MVLLARTSVATTRLLAVSIANSVAVVVGLNDVTPYGYGRAEAMQCQVRFSAAGKLLRLGLRAVTGFDLLHAWLNRSAVHVWYEGKDKPLSRHRSQYVPVEPGSLVTGFHSYGARVTPEDITFYLDRRPVWHTPTPPEHRLPLFPLLNLALGSGFSIKDTPNPSVLQVGRVRIYEAEPARAARCPAAAP
ncbi:hypothetical protein [Burkholderia gladioli]|uniref:hypothetical protein n=1 Tax=Burkholderia gladioli TaxID=28095 RepID=UPI00163ED0A7|nr:hypothetical protein [Burkholderia gladioli]